MSLCAMKLIFFIFILTTEFEMLQCASSPKLKWPLCDKSFSYETINGNDGIYPTLSDCFEVDNTDSAKFTSGADGNGLYYNGSDSCFSQVDIPSGNLKSTDFAFSIFIKPLELNGYVLHYKASSTSNTRITEIHLFFENDDLKFSITSSNGNNLGEVNIGSIQTDSWSLVQFGCYGDQNKMIAAVNGGTTMKQSISSVNFRDEGTLTVGNSHDGSQGFIGTLTCLMAFDDASSFQTRSESEKECKDTGNWGKKPGSDFSAPTCTLPPSSCP